VRRVRYDTDVVLDVLLARRPHLAAPAASWGWPRSAGSRAYVAARAVTTLASLLRRQIGPDEGRVVLADLLPRLRVAAVTGRTIRTAPAGASATSRTRCATRPRRRPGSEPQQLTGAPGSPAPARRAGP
jgi:hypothetical protein